MINPNIKKQYPVIKMPNGHPVSATMYNRNTSQGVVYTNDEEIINTGLVVNLYATSTVVANINLAHSIRSNLSATADVTDATITKGISLESSISTDNTVSANILVSKLLESNVTSTGTLVAELTVGGFDADAQAFFNRVTTAGGTLSATEQTAVNTLVIALKADGLWDKMKAIYPMVGASAAACAQNLKSSSFTGTFTSGWTFASTGVTPNGTSAYMDTNLNVNTDLSVLNSHLSYYQNTTLNGIDRMNGVYPGIFIDQISLTSGLYGVGTQRNVTLSNFLGLNHVNALTTVDYFKNGTSVATGALGSSLPSRTLWLGAANTTITNKYWWNMRMAFASIGEGLTNTEASNLYNRVQSFQTTLSRNV